MELNYATACIAAEIGPNHPYIHITAEDVESIPQRGLPVYAHLALVTLNTTG